MAKIDVVKVKIDFLKTVMVTFVFGSLAVLMVYNIQTSGINSAVVIFVIFVLGIVGYVILKILNPLLNDLEKL